MTDLSVYKKRYDHPADLKQALWSVGDNHQHELWAQPAFMMSVGLRKYHKFLDLGCGCLRGTALLVDYLEQGNFFGVDVSQSYIDQAQARLDMVGVRNKANLFCISDYDIFNLAKTKFDFILSVSILTHVMPDHIPALFSGVKECLSEKGQYFFTIYPETIYNYHGDIEAMGYKKEYLMDIGKQCGLSISDISGDYPNLCDNFLKRVNTPMLGQWAMRATLL